MVSAPAEQQAGLNDRIRGILKIYQEEIDLLTKGCRASDGHFLGLYRGLYVVADPTVSLEKAAALVENHGLERIEWEKERDGLLRDLEEARATAPNDPTKKSLGKAAPATSASSSAELSRLRKEIAEYEAEFRHLKNQDITIRNLEATLASLKGEMASQVEAAVLSSRDEVEAEASAKVVDALSRERVAADKIESLRSELRAERAARAAIEGTMAGAGRDGVAIDRAAAAERAVLLQDAERAREEGREAAAERDWWRMKAQALEGNGKEGEPTAQESDGAQKGVLDRNSTAAEVQAYKAEVDELTRSLAAAREEMAGREKETQNEKKNLQSTIDSVASECNGLKTLISELELKISSAPSVQTFDKMRHEIRLLRRLQYNAGEDEEDDAVDNLQAKTDNEEDLESVLVSRLRKVEDELIVERRRRNEAEGAVQEEKKRRTQFEKELDKAVTLVATLETDLAKAISVPDATLPSNKNDHRSTTINDLSESATLLNIIEHNSPNNPPTRTSANSSKPTASGAAISTEQQPSSAAVVNIVMAQRDRLRTKCDSLEMERDNYRRELQLSVKTSEVLKVDNVKLYEKVRYMQNFASRKVPGSAAPASGNLRADDLLDLESLEKKYETSVDPFRQFGAAERQRKFREMSPVERTVYFVAKFTLSNREMRTALFFYLLGMHALVFVTTYHWSHSHGCNLAALSNHEDLAHLHHGPPRLEMNGMN
uniref:Protein CASP n=1 Tax=Corethron hystrix TaxID=216773 RepID=A0A7S1G253_9STRA